MSTKETILKKIEILITNHFDTPENAFAFFDSNGDGKLTKSEIKKLLKQAEINGFIRGVVASKLIDGYDKDGDDLINWSEFKAAIDEITEDSY
ncbi:EF-hand domain-containing protein [Lacinutrix salivirga]